MAQDEIGQGKDVGRSQPGRKLKDPFRHFPSVTEEILEETCITTVGKCFRTQSLANAKPELAQCLCSSSYVAEIQNI